MFKKLLLGFLVISICGCKTQKTEFEEPDVESLRKDIQPTSVAIATATYRPFEFLINSSGTISSENELKISFQSSGYLERLSIKNGDRVSKGQVIGELENTQQEFAKEKAQVAYEKAYITFRDDSLGRLSNMNDVVVNTMTLKAGLRDAEINLREAQINLDNTIIKSPIDGIVAEMKEKKGDVISAGKELCVVYDDKNLELTAKILESDYKHLKLGLIADIYPLAFKNQSFEAYLKEVNPKVDENGMIELKLKLRETQGLLPGMNANAIIRVPQAKNIIVPREALVIKSRRQVVFTYENGFAKWKYVEVGLDNGVDIEILSGLNDGDQVIVSENLQLAHDAQVSIATEIGNNN
ncbi:efflux RND transporter periplasmic adaptor subunit [Roseivirga sp. E12]|uniref:efflux RND transporter periplasmic adaptor subunit n=1 Tax=Roseivirga sp. E12 TaxID=2819237 RepID=UPI001ABC3A09|nr:efflux RND transporter periplasmic adaptor subunit [Roseivirga sp. E12]MBO3700395.1 efflux RND transporter periplasmic adaptor subunit [Roseivirga sp. E12]